MLWVAFSDGVVMLFNLTDGAVMQTITVEPSNTISIDVKDDRLAIFSCAGSVEVWDTTTQQRIAAVDLPE